MATQVKVTLIGAAGTRTTEVEARGGFYTRGFKAPNPLMMPSIFGEDVQLSDSTPAPISPPTPTPPTPTPEPTADNIGDRLTSLLRSTDKYFPDRHHEMPLCYDIEGRPIMAVANADNFLECQELVENPTDPRAWHYACKTAARRSSHHSGSMDEVIKYIVLAAHCLNISKRLESREVQNGSL